MTSTVTTIKAVRDSDGTNGKPKREHGLAQLRATEARGLIRLVSEADYEGGEVLHALHELIYSNWDSASKAELEGLVAEVQLCMQAADHYLLMLGSVIDEREDTSHEQQNQDDGDPEDPGEPPF
jgi:hypothetical protein